MTISGLGYFASPLPSRYKNRKWNAQRPDVPSSLFPLFFETIRQIFGTASEWEFACCCDIPKYQCFSAILPSTSPPCLKIVCFAPQSQECRKRKWVPFEKYLLVCANQRLPVRILGHLNCCRPARILREKYNDGL